jgi:hypothetical protein
MRGFPGRFEEVPLAAIVISEAICSDVYPDRQWMASFSLSEKQPNKSLEATPGNRVLPAPSPASGAPQL